VVEKKQGDFDACVSCLSLPTCLSDRVNILASEVKGTCANPLQIGLLQGMGLARDKRTLNAVHIGLQDHTQRAGGTFTHPSGSLFMYGYVWSPMHIMTPYTTDDFSILQFSLTVSTETSFIGICLSEDLSVNQGVCVQFYGEIVANNQINTDSGVIKPSSFLFHSLAFGKPASQSSTANGLDGGNNDATNAVDGMGYRIRDEMSSLSSKSVTYTDMEEDPWWEVDLEEMYAISEIIVHMNIFDLSHDSSDLSVILYDDKNSIVFRHYIADPTDAALNKIPIPAGTKASKVRLVLLGEERTLSISEVVVVECIDGPSREIALPLGTLIPGKVVNYIAFIQSGVDDSISSFAVSESYVSELILQYGSIPEQDESQILT